MRIEFRFIIVLLLVAAGATSAVAQDSNGYEYDEMQNDFVESGNYYQLESVEGESVESVSVVIGTNIADEIEANAAGQVIFYQPDDLKDRLAKVNSVSNTTVNDNKKRVGYRIQIYTNNSQTSGKSGALKREKAFIKEYPDLATYLTFSSPYWRLRVGDFMIKEEAMLYMQQIQNLFPSFSSEVRVVKDYITDTL